ncbi:MAG: LysE family translocator [Bacteroidales bacterium]|jgi:threonine/homoserine/homoserine lactone efflux protein|nr:LysE family translocator [Bacteroidales bacterium]
MLRSFFEGLLLGLPIVLVSFTTMFAILQTSVNKGFYSGMQLAIGISLSDILLMSLCYFGLTQFIQDREFQIIIGFIGTTFILFYGIYILRKKEINPPKASKEIKLKINWTGVFSEIGKGFVLNFMNPLLWVMWITIISSGTTGKKTSEAIALIIGIAVIIFSADLLKSFFANRLNNFLSPKVLFIINKIAGLVLILCAVVLFIRTCVVFELIPCTYLP